MSGDISGLDQGEVSAVASSTDAGEAAGVPPASQAAVRSRRPVVRRRRNPASERGVKRGPVCFSRGRPHGSVMARAAPGRTRRDRTSVVPLHSALCAAVVKTEFGPQK